jgi:meso-butanediol dehydrogenase/(S,S)-butanediol dehydrogenase/diacetyl reductase
MSPVAVVTGAGRGLGRGIALALAEAGFDLVLGYGSREEDARDVASAVCAGGRRATVVGGDVSEPDTSAALAAAAAGLGGLDAWVNNAGVSILAPVIETSAADLARMIDVNLIGTFHGLRAAAHHMRKARTPGRIVNIASDLGVQGCRNLGGYAATKFAVVGLTQAAAIELASDLITVNAVCPGTAETDMVLAERASEVKLSGQTADAVRRSYLDAIPTGRFCRPEDVGGLVAWLCSSASAYVTGQAICVNGGSIVH